MPSPCPCREATEETAKHRPDLLRGTYAGRRFGVRHEQQPGTLPDYGLLVPADAEALRDHLDALNTRPEPTIAPQAWTFTTGEPFLIALDGCYAETEVVLYGNPWNNEVDWGTGPSCVECMAQRPHRLDSLGFRSASSPASLRPVVGTPHDQGPRRHPARGKDPTSSLRCASCRPEVPDAEPRVVEAKNWQWTLGNLERTCIGRAAGGWDDSLVKIGYRDGGRSMRDPHRPRPRRPCQGWVPAHGPPHPGPSVVVVPPAAISVRAERFAFGIRALLTVDLLARLIGWVFS